MAVQRDASVVAARNPGQGVESQRAKHPGMCLGDEMSESIKRVQTTGSGAAGGAVSLEPPRARPLLLCLGRAAAWVYPARVGKSGWETGQFLTTDRH